MQLNFKCFLHLILQNTQYYYYTEKSHSEYLFLWKIKLILFSCIMITLKKHMTDDCHRNLTFAVHVLLMSLYLFFSLVDKERKIFRWTSISLFWKSTLLFWIKVLHSAVIIMHYAYISLKTLLLFFNKYYFLLKCLCLYFFCHSICLNVILFILKVFFLELLHFLTLRLFFKFKKLLAMI